MLSAHPSRLFIKPIEYQEFARIPRRSDGGMLLAGGALDLIFVGKNAQAHNLHANLYFCNPRKGFTGNGDEFLQRRCDYYKQTL